ncbi:D-3-phosphoglycerate dehydrogenase [Thalictrum thalictroides]|uniref:D-3-phosphoglycerate dehydrogenase n=1 Tax=Thalictrum thalictroides TaxID=46969 RepID=A0A7J6VPP8_THATH|nr:D-3-phosphoglycerate dehydrogenase [Thalictrum thalictroides]
MATCSSKTIFLPRISLSSSSSSTRSTTSLLPFSNSSSYLSKSLKLSNSRSSSIIVTNVLKTLDSTEISVSKNQKLEATYADSKPTILVSEKLGEAGLQVLRKVANVDCSYNLSPEELCTKISLCDALIVRSGTKVTRQVFEASKGRLKVVGRAGVGIDNVDLQAATEFGCLVVNAPTANTVAAAEHGIALISSMARNVAQADASMKAGELLILISLFQFCRSVG